VAAGFIRKLFGQTAPLPPEVQDALAELSQLGQQRPALAELAGELRAIIPVLYAEPIGETSPVITAEEASARLAGKIPLLRNQTVGIDRTAFARRWDGITAVLKKRSHDRAGAISTALRQGKLDVDHLVVELMAGRAGSIHAQAEALGLDVPLTATVLWLTLFPLLSHFRVSLAPVLGGVAWPEGFCPCCGSWPKLGEFRGLEQTRFLRCGLCAGEWEFPRLQCPFCGTTDHRQLGYLHVEGEEGKYRAASCEECQHYLKMQSTLTALTPPQLLVADLATLHLDLAAAERGYCSPL
jgi:FdhE protein